MRLQCLFTSFQNLSAVSLMTFSRASVCRFRAFYDRLSCFCVSRLLGLLQPYCCIQGSSSVLYNLLTLRFRVSSSIFSLLCRRPLLSLPIEFPAVCGSVVVATFQLPTDYCRVILVFLPLCLLAFSPYTYCMSQGSRLVLSLLTMQIYNRLVVAQCLSARFLCIYAPFLT